MHFSFYIVSFNWIELMFLIMTSCSRLIKFWVTERHRSCRSLLLCCFRASGPSSALASTLALNWVFWSCNETELLWLLFIPRIQSVYFVLSTLKFNLTRSISINTWLQHLALNYSFVHLYYLPADKFYSCSALLTGGVTQGSVLGPPWFTLFTRSSGTPLDKSVNGI